MKINKIIIGFLLVSILLLSGCAPQQTQRSACNRPYISIGTSCCLDDNSNSMCDNEETIDFLISPDPIFISISNVGAVKYGTFTVKNIGNIAGQVKVELPLKENYPNNYPGIGNVGGFAIDHGGNEGVYIRPGESKRFEYSAYDTGYTLNGDYELRGSLSFDESLSYHKLINIKVRVTDINRDK